MSIKKIITVPDDILKKISDPIEKVGINEKKLIDDLFETMYHSCLLYTSDAADE